MSATQGTIRAFIALELPPQAKEALSKTIERLQSAIPSGVRWVNPSGIHLTLKFLGNIDPALVNDILKATAKAVKQSRGDPIRLKLSNLGVFPNERQPRVVWAGIEGDIETLRALQSSLDQAIAELGFPKERRPFSPHLTLGRVRDGVPASLRGSVGSALTSVTPEPSAPWRAEALYLIRSTLTPNGAIYDCLGSVPLAGA